MTPVSVIAVGAISGLGRGEAAFHTGTLGAGPPSALALDASFSAVRYPLLARVAGGPDEPELDRASWLLLEAAGDLRRELEQHLPDWRARRIGLIVGTSAGAMPSLTRALALRAASAKIPPELARQANYAAPLRALEASLGLDVGSGVQVLGACVSSTLALGIGARWLDAGECELVIAGGYDAISDFVAAGFDALGALTASHPRPFQHERDGMALGEGAALLALVRAGSGGRELGRILGFAASSDAVHLTAPDREGRGLGRAARAALEDAGLDAQAVGFVSTHATATPYNDAAEARAIADSLGARRVAVQPWKAAIGHTLGAAGALESLAAWDALARGLRPAAPGAGTPEFSTLELSPTNTAGTARAALKLSAAFGGANAALVLAAPGAVSGVAPRPHPRHAVSLVATCPWFEQPELERVAALGAGAAQTAARADALSALALTAVARLVAQLAAPLPEETAVVLGSDGATVELDERFDRRRREGRPVEPRRFPATSPNLGAGSCSIAFGLRGPAFAVGGGPGAGERALGLAYDLVAAGDAPAAIAVLAEDAGPALSDLFAAAGFPVPRTGARAMLLVRGAERPVFRPELRWEV